MIEEIITKTIRDDDGLVVYEGETLFDKPYGIGRKYFANGTVYQEGRFGIKGLIEGKEYYPNGQIRFEGLFRFARDMGRTILLRENVMTSRENYIMMAPFLAHLAV